MQARRLTTAGAVILLVCTSPAIAQNATRTPQLPANAAHKTGPYQAVPVTPPQTMNDPAMEGLRKQLGAAAQRKDRVALAKLVVTQGFFWLGENGDRADKRKSGADNLTNALGLNNKDGPGWDMLASFADDPTGSPSPDRKGAICAPADPSFDGKSFSALLDATSTDAGEWGYPVSSDVVVHAAPQTNAPAIEKLGLFFIRIVPEIGSNIPSFLRIVTPAGKIGFVSADSVAPLGNDQICYVKDTAGWKIGGYIGGGDSQ